MEKDLIVKCPFCGMEYHLSEIAMPYDLTGKPRINGIVKDPEGKIIYLDWEDEPTTVLEYCCDHCEREFLVRVKLSAEAVSKSPDEDFSINSTSLLD